MFTMKAIIFHAGCLMATLVLWAHTAGCRAETDMTGLLGKNDACLLKDPAGRPVVSVNVDQLLVPASTLKILTALTAYHYLGADYRFHTDVYLDASGNLKIRGHGDPLLISEVLAALADAALPLITRRTNRLENMVLDNSFFADPLTIPGVSDSFEPYDAPNGALCANFNTVSFQRLKNGAYVSAEPQTPLLAAARPRIRASGLEKGRIVLTNREDEAVRYLGHLMAYFLAQRGVPLAGRIELGKIDPAADERILSFASPYSLDETITKLMAFSNNFIANQLLIAAGARAFGPPGTIAKGVRAAREYAGQQLGLSGFHMVEGSGISRDNRVSARAMLVMLQAFEFHCERLRQTGKEYYKTGTLNGISTRAGYIKGPGGKRYPFVVMLNTPGQPVMDRVMKALFKRVIR